MRLAVELLSWTDQNGEENKNCLPLHYCDKWGRRQEGGEEKKRKYRQPLRLLSPTLSEHVREEGGRRKEWGRKSEHRFVFSYLCVGLKGGREGGGWRGDLLAAPPSAPRE